jgi:hypothetical protein
VQAHGGVGEEEAAGMLLVGPDAAHFGGQVEDHFGLGQPVQAHHVDVLGKVEVLAARHEDVRNAPLLQLAHQDLADEAGPTRDDRPLPF